MVCPPLRWCRVQKACAVTCFCSRHPVFALGSSEVAVGFFGLFVSFVQNLPRLYMHAVIFSPIWFLCILFLQERFVQVQAMQHCSKGSQVPACLTTSGVSSVCQWPQRGPLPLLPKPRGTHSLVALYCTSDS